MATTPTIKLDYSVHLKGTPFALADANGNCVTYSDNSGNVQAHYTYDAFGGTVSSDGDMDDDFNFRFSSKYLDDETGLYYYGYRYDSPVLGRWLNRDPIEEWGGLNIYAFVWNDSICIADILGLAGSTTHGTQSCKPGDSCEALRAKLFQWSAHALERSQELAADKYNLKKTDPERYNNHIDELVKAARNLNNCFNYYIWHQPPCCKKPPKRTGGIRIPERINTLSLTDRILIRVPGSDETWENIAIASGGVAIVAGGTAAIIATGGAATPIVAEAARHAPSLVPVLVR